MERMNDKGMMPTIFCTICCQKFKRRCFIQKSSWLTYATVIKRLEVMEYLMTKETLSKLCPSHFSNN